MDLKVATALDSEAEALVPCPRGQAVGQHQTGGNLEDRVVELGPWRLGVQQAWKRESRRQSGSRAM